MVYLVKFLISVCMIYSVNDSRVKELEIEQLMSFMFKDYPEIIEGYNWNIFPLLRASDILESILFFREKLVNLNFSINERWIIQEEEEKFTQELLWLYWKYLKHKNSTEKLNNIWDVFWSIKEMEENNKEMNMGVEELLESISHVF